MTIGIIVTICSLIILAYIFDLTSSRTKIPSVIVLFLLGWGAQQVSQLLKLPIPDLNPLLPILGTIGLILIVLDGSLELELLQSRFPLIRKSFLVALLPMAGLSLFLAFAFQYYGGFSFKDSLINAIPLCVISSAIAIPSAKNLSTHDREFIIYESSLSDIIGIMFFDFMVLNTTIDALSFLHFALQLVIILIISFAATVGLAMLLRRIEHRIKFVPIMILVILIYSVSKMYHLPALIFIMLFGLLMGNLHQMNFSLPLLSKVKLEELSKEVHKFKEIAGEGTFLIRTMFFLLFGFLIDTRELLNTETISWAAIIGAGIFAFRFVQLKFLNLPVVPLLFIAPRGLITILLFLAITPDHAIGIVNKPLIIQVIIFTALVMMVGLMMVKSVSRSVKEQVVNAATAPDDKTNPQS